MDEHAIEVNVVQVLLSPRIGGAESLVSSLNAYWKDTKILSETVYLDDNSNSIRNRILRLTTLRRKIKSKRADVVIAHSLIPSIYARLVTPISVPVISVLHSAGDDYADWKLRLVERILRLRTAHIVAVSGVQMEQYVGYFGVGRNISVVPNGIRSEIVTKSSTEGSLCSMTTISRVARQKNPFLWIDVAAALFNIDSAPNMVWWGPIASEDDIRDAVSGCQRFESVGRFLGPTDDPAAQLLAADALFHPSDQEAHSIGILEAAAAGLPIVCSSSVARTLTSDIVVVEFETGNAASAVAAVQELMRSWGALSERALSSAQGIRQKFSIDECAHEYESIIRSIVRK